MLQEEPLERYTLDHSLSASLWLSQQDFCPREIRLMECTAHHRKESILILPETIGASMDL